MLDSRESVLVRCVGSRVTARGEDWFEAELSVGTWLFNVRKPRPVL